MTIQNKCSPSLGQIFTVKNIIIPAFDYFYHVLLTPYRQFIWEIPVSLIPVREDGTFITANSVTLDRDNWKRKKANIDWKKHLIQSSYDPIVFKKYPDFFSRPEPITLDMFA